MTERPGVEQIARVLFDAMGWTTRKADVAGTYGLVHPLPRGLVTGDPDNEEWTKLATRLYDAGLRAATPAPPEPDLDVACTCGVTGWDEPHHNDCAALIESRRRFGENIERLIAERVAIDRADLLAQIEKAISDEHRKGNLNLLGRENLEAAIRAAAPVEPE